MASYSGSEWIISSGRFVGRAELSVLGKKVANLLGDLFFGIYHLNHTSMGKVDWTNESWIEVTIGKSLATYDFDELTRLVVLCHDRGVRCEVIGLAHGYLRLRFHNRPRREGRVHESHPCMEEAIHTIRRDYATEGAGEEVLPEEEANVLR